MKLRVNIDRSNLMEEKIGTLASLLNLLKIPIIFTKTPHICFK